MKGRSLEPDSVLPTAPEPPQLGGAARIAIRWNAAAALVTLLAQFTQILVLARGLTPAEFGLAAAALALAAFLGGLSDLGLTNALLHHGSLSAKAWASAWWATAAAGTLFGIALILSAPAAESLLRLPGLGTLLAAAALSLPLIGAASVFQAHLQRELRLRRLASVEIFAALSALAVSLVWMMWRPEAMALVAGQITFAIVRFTGLGLASSLRPAPRLRWAELRPVAGFSGYQVVERIAAHAIGNFDRLLVARLLGPAAAGFYFMASQIALKPAALIGPFTSRTLLPLLVRIRDDRARTASSYLRSLSLLSLLAAVVYTALFGLAEPLIALVLGTGWEPVVPVLRVLSVAGFLFVLGNALGNLALALGRAGASFWTSLVVLIIRLGALVVGARYGLEGAALALLMVTVLSIPIDYVLPRLWLGITTMQMTRAGAWPVIPAVSAASAMMVLTALMTVHAAVELALAGLSGAVVFVVVAWLFHRRALGEAWRELADKLGRR